MNEAIELLENMKRNMETVQTISVPYHVNQIKAAIAEIQALQVELDKYKPKLVAEPQNGVGC